MRYEDRDKLGVARRRDYRGVADALVVIGQRLVAPAESAISPIPGIRPGVGRRIARVVAGRDR